MPCVEHLFQRKKKNNIKTNCDIFYLFTACLNLRFCAIVFFFYSEWFNLGRTTSRLCVLFASTAYTSIAFSNSTSNTLINHSCKMKTKGKITGIGPLKRRRFHFTQVSCSIYLNMILLYLFIYISATPLISLRVFAFT